MDGQFNRFKFSSSPDVECVLETYKGGALEQLARFGYITKAEAKQYARDLEALPTDDRGLIIAYCAVPFAVITTSTTNTASVVDRAIDEAVDEAFAERISVKRASEAVEAEAVKSIWQKVSTFVYSLRKRLHSYLLPLVESTPVNGKEERSPEQVLEALELAFLNGVDKTFRNMVEALDSPEGVPFIFRQYPKYSDVVTYWGVFVLLELLTAYGINFPFSSVAIEKAQAVTEDYTKMLQEHLTL